MPSFDVRFIKTVCDDTGHEHRACQAAFTVDAASLTEAVQRAEALFCGQKRIHDWTLFADAVEFRSRTALAAHGRRLAAARTSRDPVAISGNSGRIDLDQPGGPGEPK